MNNYKKVVEKFNFKEIESIHGQAEETLFSQGDLNHENWATASFYHCRFEGVFFEFSLMQNISFFSNVFNQCSFKESVLSGIQFNSSILENSNFIGSDLSGCNFYKTNLSGSDFRNAKLEGCNFWDTDLSYCNFQGADLSLCDVKNVRNLYGAKFDKRTKLPFSKIEAQKYGMIYSASNHLSLVNQDKSLGSNKSVIYLQDYQNLKSKKEFKNQASFSNNVIKISDYFKKTSGTDDDGPTIA